MAENSYNDLLKAIQKGNPAPVYFLHGEESYYIDVLTDAIINNTLAESERDFNLNILYGKDADIDTIKSLVNKYPMMASRQVVVIKEAQELKQIESLLNYVKKPVKSTVLIIGYKHKKMDKRTKFYKTLKDQESVQLFESKKISERKIRYWITEYLSEKGYQIDEKAAYLLSEYLGNDLKKITNELDKLLLDDTIQGQISSEHIEKNIGISKDYNVFELQNALGKKDVVTITKILNYYRANPKANPLPMMTTILFNYFSKLFALRHTKGNQKEIGKSLGIPDFALNDHLKAANNYDNKLDHVFEIIHDFDLRARGINDGGNSEPELMKEMVYKIVYL